MHQIAVIVKSNFQKFSETILPKYTSEKKRQNQKKLAHESLLMVVKSSWNHNKVICNKSVLMIGFWFSITQFWRIYAHCPRNWILRENGHFSIDKRQRIQTYRQNNLLIWIPLEIWVHQKSNNEKRYVTKVTTMLKKTAINSLSISCTTKYA